MTLSQIQHLLAYLGYYIIPVDGIAGPGTTSAIKNFQTDYGLSSDGIAGAATQKALKGAVAYGMPDKPSPAPDDFWSTVKHFKRSEFLCKCGGRYCNQDTAEPDHRLVRLLDQMRDDLGVEVIITSGIRCPRHNAAVGGVSNSQHLYGTAADVVANGISPAKVAEYAESKLKDTGGIGRYNGFTHIDVRAVKSRWRG